MLTLIEIECWYQPGVLWFTNTFYHLRFSFILNFLYRAKKIGLQHNLKALEGIEEDNFSYNLAKKLVFNMVKKNLGFDRIRRIIIGGAPVSRETIDYFLSLDIRLYEGFGMSEATGAHIGNRPGDHRLGTVGRTLDGFHTKIIDPDPEGNGEIW